MHMDSMVGVVRAIPLLTQTSLYKCAAGKFGMSFSLVDS